MPPTAGPPTPAPPYTRVDSQTFGKIRGRLFFPSEYIPPLAVYAVAVDGSAFYRVDTAPVPPGGPSYEIPVVASGTYSVYAHPILDEASFGGVYSYLAACEAGHISAPSDGCWENPRHELAPVVVRVGQAVEEIDIFDWYTPSPPPPPDNTSSWPTYVNEQLSYRIRIPPHWDLQKEMEGETTFGRRDAPEQVLGSIRVTNGDPEELADQLIASLPLGQVAAREWATFAGRKSLHLVLDLPDGRFTWWFAPRYELVYIVHTVTDSGLGSFDQMMATFEFVEQ